jgi:preprotein translocase subunit SecF
MKLDFIGKRSQFYMLSLVIVLISAFLVFSKGLNLSIDFKSGSVMRLRFEAQDAEKISTQKLEEILQTDAFKAYFNKVKIQEIDKSQVIGETGREFFITSDFLPEQTGKDDVKSNLERELQKIYPTATTSEFRNIGPAIGGDLKNSALASIFFSIVVIILYITIRFEFRFSVVSIIALVHDVTIVLGIFALLGKEFSPSAIAAVLTIIGYSLNDTIVILDRIRENLRLMRKQDYGTIINTSINQSLSRTVKTSVTTILPIVVLLLWGGASLESFTLAMFIGVIVGTYSSVCLAAPVLVSWNLSDKQTSTAA